MSECETTADLMWLLHRFDGRCYFYPGRDCPGWMPGGVCGRMGLRIPGDAVPDGVCA